MNRTRWFSLNCEFRRVVAVFTGFNITKYAQCELLSNVSYGWNVLKRINNYYFSSNSLLFLTNAQQLKAFVSPGGLLQWKCIWGQTRSCHVWYVCFSHVQWALLHLLSYTQKADTAAWSHYHRHFFMAPWERGRNWWMTMLEAQA